MDTETTRPHASHRTPEVGERVALTGGGTGKPSMTTVDRLTKTQIVVASGAKFNIESRRQVGELTYDRKRLVTSDEPEFAHFARVARDNRTTRVVQQVLSAAASAPLSPEALEGAARQLLSIAKRLRAQEEDQ